MLDFPSIIPEEGEKKGSAGQGGSCGFGMRGQKSRRGFQGGQMPLYRRIPKLRGIAGASYLMIIALRYHYADTNVACFRISWHSAGLPMYVPVNLKDIADAEFEEGEEERDLSVKLDFKARAFSASAKEKIEAAGCSLPVLPGRKKWVKPSVSKNLARAEEYFAKKRASTDWTDSPSA
ncbi:hypothetical protein SASPL_130825 [Salvia splendens]|uniref:Large ribosomal subunit protein uL15/eL18 domain-containing protein n=1 Tax=Salvia splendens TaxID=180675 RepID=A0A8X8X6E5_SALSN|nr:hypothetical protein SASPL_130825 [Salvia splendens]